MNLYGAHFLGRFRIGDRIIYWCKKQKLRLDKLRIHYS